MARVCGVGENRDKIAGSTQNIDPCRDNLHIFEYDRRFEEVYPIEYVYYDFNEPDQVPEHLHHSFDLIHFDPPYLVRTMLGLSKNLEQR